MSRSCYSEDFGEDFPGQMELFRANVDRSMRSKTGQARLRELRDALLALPVKELEADIFAEGRQEAPRVCALGAWAVAKTGDVEVARHMVRSDCDDYETYNALKPHGWPRLVVMETVYQNDDARYVYETVEGPQESSYGRGPVQYRRIETPGERYQRVLAWVQEQLVG